MPRSNRKQPNHGAAAGCHPLAGQVCVVDYVRDEGIGVVVDSLVEPFPEDLFQQACPLPLYCCTLLPRSVARVARMHLA